MLKAEDKLRVLQRKLTKTTPKLKAARQEHEKTTDLLFEEKKNNIKLMKNIQQYKMTNHQNEYHAKDLREQVGTLQRRLEAQAHMTRTEKDKEMLL